MKNVSKWLAVSCLYLALAAAVVLGILYFYQNCEAFRGLFSTGGTVVPPENLTAAEAAESMNRNAETAGKFSLGILIFVLLLQVFAFTTAVLVYSGIRKSADSLTLKLKKTENAELFLDLPLYFGLFGTVSSFVVMTFQPQVSRLIAYSSTLVGIIFSVILRVILQYPLKQKLSALLDSGERR